MAYTLYTQSFGASNALAEVFISEVSSGLPAIILSTATGGVVSDRGQAYLDSNGDLSVFIDTARTWQFKVWDRDSALAPPGGGGGGGGSPSQGSANVVQLSDGAGAFLAATGMTFASGALSLPNGITASGGGFVVKGTTGQVFVWSGGLIGFSNAGTVAQTSNMDVCLARDGPNTLAQRNNANAQTFRTYGTWTDASNGRWLDLSMTTAGVASIRPTGNGTGASGNLLHISGLPTSNPGAGILWNDAGTVKVGT